MLARTMRTHLTLVLLAFVAVGFAALLIELLLISHTFGLQRIAVGSVAIGLLVSLVAFVPRVGVRRIVLVLFVLLALVGLFGFFIHVTSRTRRQEQVASVQPPDDRLLHRAVTNFGRNPPLIPPLGLTGLATLGIVTLLGAEAPAPETRERRQAQMTTD